VVEKPGPARIFAKYRDFGRGCRGMFFIKALVPIAFSAWITFGNPLDIGSSSQRYSRDVWNAIFGAAAPDTAADQIAVVVANDTTLGALGQSWPLPYAVHADIISAILADKPRLLVIDILFVDSRRHDGTLDALADAIASAGDTRVVLAAAPVRHGNDIEILPALAPGAVGRDGARIALGSADTSPATGAHSPYRLQNDTGPVSIALAAYTQWCASEAAYRPARAFCRHAPHRADYEANMEVFWPVGLAAQDRTPGTRGVTCAAAPSGKIARLAAAVGGGFSLAPLIQRCPPYPTILAQTIVRPRGHEETLTAAFRDKAVFYGTSIVGSADLIDVAHLSDPLPGVFVHAAAFENLLRMGDDYLKDASGVRFLSENGLEFAASGVITVLVFVWALFAQRVPPSHPRRVLKIVVMALGALLAILGAVAALLAVEFAVLRVAPSNWIGLLATALAALAVVEPAFESRPATKEQ
jgi:CHASE2 domain-containing sensor protein